MPDTRRFIVRAILGVLLPLAWTKSEMAQTQESAADEQSGAQNQSAAANEESGTDNQSSSELAKQAANPLSSGWLMQTQQNNNWVGMPSNSDLMNVKLTDNWTLFTRPILTLFNSTPYVDPSGHGERTTAFGDTVLAFALAPRPLCGGHLMIGAGPTFSYHLLGQHTWQLGPDLGVVWLGKHFIAYAFPQQWFKIGAAVQKPIN
jgi:hypothetical protein